MKATQGAAGSMAATATAGGDQAGQTQTGEQTGMAGTKNLLTKRYKKPAYLQSLNESEKAENFKIIDNMAKRIAYLRNPRFKVNKSPILMTKVSVAGPTDHSQAEEQEGANVSVNPFRTEPSVISFADYQQKGVYEVPLKVTNSSTISQRIKFIPPSSEFFTIRKVKYPSSDHGCVAPGMSLILFVTFYAEDLADYDDFVNFVAEDLSFKVPIRARREPPVISLSNPMDCLSSWMGDRVDMAFRCVNTGGDGGFKFFCERDEDDSKQIEADTIKIGPFSLTPAEFYLYQGNAIDVCVSFQPNKEGHLNENLILACDNKTSEFYKLSGYGAMLDLEIIAVDGREVDFKKHPFNTFHFENTNPTSESRRTIRVKNVSPIVVPFHWSIYKSKNTNKITLQDEQTHYRVEPSQGKLKGGNSMEFEVFFCPDHAEPYYEFADLIVEDIPIQSVRNAPEGLKSFAAQTTKGRIPMPTYVGSNTQFLSVPLIQFNLRGQGNSCAVELDPPIVFFEGDMFIGHSYNQQVRLKKLSEGAIHYKLSQEGKNCDGFDIDLRVDGRSLENGCAAGDIQNREYITLDVTVHSTECGDKVGYYFLEVEDGPPISFQVLANFKGPIVHLKEPSLDYGLIKINSHQQISIHIQNTSPVPAEIEIKNARPIKVGQRQDSASNQSRTSGGNMVKLTPNSMVLGPKSTQQVVVSLDALRPETVDEHFEISVRNSPSQFFNVIAEIQKPRVTLNRNSIELGRIYAGVTEVIDVKHKQSLKLKNFGNLPVLFNWIEKYDQERIVARFEPCRGTIPPKEEIEIYFSATVYYGGLIDELFLCEIQDVQIPLGFEFKADAFGLQVCYETSEDQAQAAMSVLGLTQTSLTHQEAVSGAALEHTAMVSATSEAMRATKLAEPHLHKLQVLNFPSCTINKSSTQKFILKNLSGIKTQFHFQTNTFEPPSHQAPQQKSDVQKAAEEAAALAKEESKIDSSPSHSRQVSAAGKTGGKQIRFAPSAKSGGSTRFGFKKDSPQKLARPILSDEHEQTNKFSSATGQTFTQTMKLEKEQAFFLSNNKGIAVVFNPDMGELPAHSEVPVTVTIYNNVCGKFNDVFVSQVKGLPQFEFPLSIHISGSPVTIPVNQVGLNYKTLPPTLPMPTVVCNSQPIAKQFKIKNTGIREVQVDWKIFDNKDLKNQDTDLFSLSIDKNTAYDRKENPWKWNFQAVEPEESEDSAFTIEPKTAVVASRQIKHFTVSFNSYKGVGEFRSIMLASPELAPEELEMADEGDDFTKKGALGIISLNLLANSITPKLSVDRKTRQDEMNHVNIKYWSVPHDQFAPSGVQKLTYVNETKADLIFNLSVLGPFQIVKTKSNTGAKHPLVPSTPPTKVIKGKSHVETQFCLQPLKIVEVHVKFAAPASTDREEWPNIMQVEKSGELQAAFQNGEMQPLRLDGYLLRPKLVLLTEKPSKNDKAMDELDFSIVNIEKFRQIRVFLSNMTAVTAKWQLNYIKFPKKSTLGYNTTTPWEQENIEKTDDPDVFEFSLTEGAIRGKSLPLKLVPDGLCVPPVPKDDEELQFLPQELYINFRPKANVLYKSKFRFTVEGGISCDVILKGKGSYEEDHD